MALDVALDRPGRSTSSPEVTGPAGSTPGRPARWVHRTRLAVVCLGFLALTLSQQPGRLVADTKLDLVVDPLGFLGRALHMWEPLGFAGQVQNQAYGYLFPMGPFFVLGEASGVPMWVVQRLWMALLLTVAFLGVTTLARRLRIGTPESQLLAGLGYALAPRMVTGLGATSIEVLPMALAPWVLVPLVAGAAGGSPRRAAALSGLAVFCVGGVNAVATAAVLPLAALWLLTRPAGPRRRRLIGWWSASVLLAPAWWAGPLLLLGRYSPPFLDYIESAGTTTSVTELTTALRGTTQWLAYLGTGTGPLWPAGWALARDTVPLLATVVLAAAGLVALSRRDLPERTWLVLGVLAGLVLVTAGHRGAVSGVLADPLHTALDGVLAPLRNVHKFDPVIRLPLALGLAHLAGRLWRGTRRGPRVVAGAARAGIGLLVLALLTTASPALAGRLSPPPGFTGIPGYWQQTADWLADAQPEGRALLAPASSFATYVWGGTSDEPLQALASSAWEVRNAVPVASTGHIRVLDAIEERLAAGRGSAGLTRYLARSGISHVVLRNDLDAGTAGSARSIAVRRALSNSPGVTRVATFGPELYAATTLFGRVLDAGLAQPVTAVEVYAVADPAPQVSAVPLADAVTVRGGPDGVLSLEERDLLGGRPALVADGPSATGTTLVSDALVRRERTFGQISDAQSAGLTADDPLRLANPARDYLIPDVAGNESVVRLSGATVTASDSAADAGTLGGARPSETPFAALDGDPATAWRPADRLRGAPGGGGAVVAPPARDGG